MKLRPLVRAALGLTMLVAAGSVWVAVGDRQWGAALVLSVLTFACAYPAFTGRDPFDRRRRRHRRHRRHRSKRHGAASGAPASSSQTTTIEMDQ